MIFLTIESKAYKCQFSTFSIKQYRIIVENPTEDMCDGQSKNFSYPFFRFKNHLFKTWFTWLVNISLYFLQKMLLIHL